MSAQTIKEVLIEARKVIEDPEHWARGDFAYDEQGNPVDVDADRACRWCAVGAVWKVLGRENGGNPLHSAWGVLNAAACDLYRVGSVQGVNDDKGRSHADVLAIYDRAIERAL